MSQKRSQTRTADRKRQSVNRSDSEDESEEDASTVFIKEKENVIKDCLVYMLAHNSTLLPVKKNDVIQKFGEKISRKCRNAIFKVLKRKLLTIGVCMKNVDGSRFILVNKFPKSLISDIATATPEKKFLCLVLTLIIFNRGSLIKPELENCLASLGIDIQTSHPYFGDISKSLQLYEKQCYLKKSIIENVTTLEWGVRASCEVESDLLVHNFEEILCVDKECLPTINLDLITPPEHDVVSGEED